MRHSFRRNNKAVSTIFGMVFFLLIVVIVFASFAVVLNQSTSLEATMIQSRQMDIDKARESLVLKSAAYVGNTFTYIINNTGTISAQVVRLWVEGSNGNSAFYAVPLNEQVFLPNSERAITGTATGSGVSGNYRYYFVTARGNQFTVLMQGGKGQDGDPGRNGADGIVTSTRVAQGIGSIEMNFTTFRVYSVSGSTLTGYSPNGMGGSPGYSTGTSNIAFSVNVTNVDLNKRAITLNSHSVFWTIFPTQGTQVRCAFWYIVRVNSGGTVIAGAPTIPLPYNQTVCITFAAASDMGSNGFGRQSSGYSGPSAAFLNLIGSFNTGDAFGQNLPFVSVYFS